MTSHLKYPKWKKEIRCRCELHASLFFRHLSLFECTNASEWKKASRDSSSLTWKVVRQSIFFISFLKYPRFTKKTNCAVLFVLSPFEPLESRDAFPVNLHSRFFCKCFTKTASRDSNGPKKSWTYNAVRQPVFSVSLVNYQNNYT